MTINNKTSGDVKVTGKPAKINLKFFAYADKDHMPLRRVMIDWGTAAEFSYGCCTYIPKI